MHLLMWLKANSALNPIHTNAIKPIHTGAGGAADSKSSKTRIKTNLESKFLAAKSSPINTLRWGGRWGRPGRWSRWSGWNDFPNLQTLMVASWLTGWACVTYQTGMVGWFMWLVRLDSLGGISVVDSSINFRIFYNIFGLV